MKQPKKTSPQSKPPQKIPTQQALKQILIKRTLIKQTLINQTLIKRTLIKRTLIKPHKTIVTKQNPHKKISIQAPFTDRLHQVILVISPFAVNRTRIGFRKKSGCNSD